MIISLLYCIKVFQLEKIRKEKVAVNATLYFLLTGTLQYLTELI